MRWWWESSHFSGALGDLVIYRIQQRSPPDGIADGFGMRLDSGSLETRLAQVRADRERWVERNPAEASRIRQLAGHERSARGARPR